MIKDMQIHFSPIATLITKMFMYKKGMLLPLSGFISLGIEAISNFLNTSFLGVSTSFLILISVMFTVDFFTGVWASKYEEKKAIKVNDLKLAAEKKFSSKKINFTFFKFIMLFLWIWLAERIGFRIEKVEYINVIYSVITVIPLVLVSLREYISIGENIGRVYGKKPYIFTLVEKIFDALEGKFLKKIDNED